ncbi:Csu type fimbrial protein [Psychrobacter sp. DAB_AL62B]|uniref:Csu type fimbrial protein n=1 Tax=Psychrobacter sp. DAB_AL62B TaxID=1028420 RepID=UPI002381107B|nr:spore coat protein U domain-containing protein [Psychrobacter sp. DAB_AL62B]MDE4455266.1 spore coat U domain-containing protein [Psychrobacter sp. DAB_AL62B]
MKIKIFQWRYSPFLILLPLWLPTGNVQAALSVTCKAGMNAVPGATGLVNFDPITSDDVGSASISGTLNYSCTNTGNTPGYVSVCLAADGGDKPSAVIPRYMKTVPSNRELAFNMTLSKGGIWGTRNPGVGTEYSSGPIYIPARPYLFGQSTISGKETINISLLSSNAQPVPGIYSNNFNGAHTAITISTNVNQNLSNCLTPEAQGTIRFPFTVQAIVIPSCKVTAKPNIDLGPHPASEKDITGNNAIGITCTNTTAYNIGLAPSNGSLNGAGLMKGSDTNPIVPYQLRSATGLGGAIWGNTATSTSVGNGVKGTGSGEVQNKTVYVTVPSADFKPDTYSDTVTIRVNY